MNALKLWCKAHSVYSEANKAESLFEGLTGRMKANGWTLIYYGDGGPGDQKLKILRGLNFVPVRSRSSAPKKRLCNTFFKAFF